MSEIPEIGKTMSTHLGCLLQVGTNSKLLSTTVPFGCEILSRSNR
jgi:hypothetical protein